MDDGQMITLVEDMTAVLGDDLVFQLREALAQVVTAREERREQEEGATYHGIVRYTHVRCGYTTRVRGEMELLNDLDPACPRCSERRGDGLTVGYPYGSMVWEQANGTLIETVVDTEGSLVSHRRVFTHVKIYKSWVNGPEWWVIPEPGTGDLDDEFIVGFDHYWQARAALPGIRQIFEEMAPPDGLSWRQRTDPIYRLTPPNREVPVTQPANPTTPLPPESTREAAVRELEASAGALSLTTIGAEFEDNEHTEVWLDWALHVKAWGFTWAEALTIARVWYFG